MYLFEAMCNRMSIYPQSYCKSVTGPDLQIRCPDSIAFSTLFCSHCSQKEIWSSNYFVAEQNIPWTKLCQPQCEITRTLDKKWGGLGFDSGSIIIILAEFMLLIYLICYFKWTYIFKNLNNFRLSLSNIYEITCSI